MADLLQEITTAFNTLKKTAAKPKPSLRGVASREIQEGVLTPVVYAMICDGEKQDAEKLQLFVMLISSPVFDGVSAQEFSTLVQEIEAKMLPVSAARGEEVVRAAVKPLTESLRETAYAYALRMIYADKNVQAWERQLINDLPGWMGLSGEAPKRITATMEVLARTPVG